MFRYAGRIPFWLLRLAPALATVMTSFAVYFSGDSTSGYALFYVWVGLYVFYFPVSRADAAINVLWAFANYAVVIALTPAAPAGAFHTDVHHFVITAGTLITAATLLTYLRIRVERLMRRLTDAARTDALTGLPNRVALHEALERELERAKPEERPTSLLIFDIDRFKRVNDRYGVSEGDRVVRRVAALLEESTRIMDVVARSGGEEFAIVLPETDQHRAFLFAEELLDRVRKDFTAPQIELTASIGVATSPGHADDLAGLMAASDGALHAAKALGRDRAVIYSPEVTNVLGSVTGPPQRRDPGPDGDRAQPRRGARPARLGHRPPQPDRRAPLRDDGRRARPRRGPRAARCGSRGSSTTSARSRVPDSILMQARPADRRRVGARCAATPSSAPASSPAASSTTSASGSWPTTSAPTATATRRA